MSLPLSPVTPGPSERHATTSSDNSVASVSTPPGMKLQHSDSCSENLSEEQSHHQPTSRRRLMDETQEDTVATNENGGGDVTTAATVASSPPTTNNGDRTIDDTDLENEQTGNNDNNDGALPSTHDNAHSIREVEDEEMDQDNGTASQDVTNVATKMTSLELWQLQ